MNGSRTFLDTNVLVYAFDDDAGWKRERAWEVIDQLNAMGGAVVSTQVLQEFYVVTTRKLARPLPEQDAEDAVRTLCRWPVARSDAALVEAAIGVSRRYQLSLWDALILRAAGETGCSRVLSEDMQSGLEVDGVVVHNPFVRSPGATKAP